MSELREKYAGLIRESRTALWQVGINTLTRGDVQALIDALESLLEDAEAAVEAAKRNTFVEEWNHGCAGVCSNISLWVTRCPHCGMPAPEATAKTA